MSFDEDDGARGWDLTPVIDLIYSLSSNSVSPPKVEVPPTPIDQSIDGVTSDPSSAALLGNFDKLWASLGKPLDSPPPKTTAVENHPQIGADPHLDPALLPTSIVSSKGVRWRDEDGTADLEDNVGGHDGAAARWEQRRDERLAQALRRKKKKLDRKGLRSQKTTLPTSSDNESDNELRSLRSSPVLQPRKIPLRPSQVAPRPDEDTEPSSTSPPKSSVLKGQQAWPVSKPYLWKPPPHSIEPTANLSVVERKARLMMKLAKDFRLETKYLLGLPGFKHPQLGGSNDLHVFIDCSNIMIGFHETLKRARGIPEHARPRGVPLAFHSLALILERGRPVAKRVLAGSKPLIPAMREAEDCGYEALILEQVLKARDITPRKKRYQNGQATSGPSSGSETPGPVKRVEQGVDEILHLRMMESLVDAKHPSTMVLATGDAAEAEYSEGFMKMVERAMDKGWKVEVVSFSRNMSYAYRRKAAKSQYRNQFKIIELDGYAEELLDL
ncbi:MAG: hypothetical protein M1817_006775 [Caeruleum heppii]|nr:MAG: hypothetical protein M1817_006775 [Caeruleum heppii]